MKMTKEIKQLTLSAILTGINISLLLLNLLLPFFSFFMIIAIPFSTALLILKCQKRYNVIYVFATLLISCIFDFHTSLFYVIPRIKTGITLGILIKKKLHGFFIAIITSLVHTIVELGSFFLIKLIYNVNIFTIFQEFFKLSESEFFNISLSFFFLFSLITVLLIYFVIEEELPKFQYRINENHNIFIPLSIISISISIISIPALYLLPIIGHLITSISIIFIIYILFHLLRASNNLLKIIYFGLYFISLIVIIFISSYVKEFGLHLIFNIFSITTSINNVIFIIYTSFKKIVIEPSLFDKKEEKEEY